MLRIHLDCFGVDPMAELAEGLSGKPVHNDQAGRSLKLNMVSGAAKQGGGERDRRSVWLASRWL